MVSTMIDDYIVTFKECKEKYGEKTCLLILVGSFWESYEINNKEEKIGNAEEVAEIVSCTFTNKNKKEKVNNGNYSTRTYPDFFGFNDWSLSKYVPILLNADYTVVLMEPIEGKQKNKILKRGITKVYSPSLKSPEYETKGDTDNNIVGVFIELIDKETMFYSVSSFNNVTNEIEVMDSYAKKDSINELERIFLRYNIKELIIHSPDQISTDIFESYNYKFIKVDDYNEKKKVDYQNQYYKEIYKNTNFGLLLPLEYFNLTPLQSVNLIYMFDYISRFSKKYLENIVAPKIIQDTNHLVLALNTITQLNIKEVFDIINCTSTAIGRRCLKNLLSKPFNNTETINNRYELTEELKKINRLDYIEKNLIKVSDFERIHRKMALQAMVFNDFERLHETYMVINELLNIEISIKPKEDVLALFNEYIDNYTNTFLINNCSKINYFKKGKIPELDTIEDKIDNCEEKIEKIRLQFDKEFGENSNFIKLDTTDQDGMFFTCTKIRFQKINEKYKDTIYKTKHTGNTTKFFTKELDTISMTLISNRSLLTKKVQLHFELKQQEYYKKYNDMFYELKKFIELLDITKSNIKCSEKYNYTRPIIKVKKESYLKCTSIRHPIIERIIKTEYITNDIDLSKGGVLLYGLNSGGKSSLLRAIGINLILAQCGLYVACDTFVYHPFNNIISQVDLMDNLFEGKSSFISEMTGLKKILSITGPNTLVLSDELSKGTNFYDSIAIVSSTVLELIKSNTKFFFTSHIHEIADLQEIKSSKKLQIKHLSVSTNDQTIIFDRKLKDGSGPSIYGLEVAKAIIQHDSFFDRALFIRNTVLGKESSILPIKKSKYNKKKLVTKCEICGHISAKGNSPIETHHINFQKDCDPNGFVKLKHFHKNEIYNLVSLCKDCHHKIDTKELIINGYKSSTDGIFLDYQINQKTNI